MSWGLNIVYSKIGLKMKVTLEQLRLLFEVFGLVLFGLAYLAYFVESLSCLCRSFLGNLCCYDLYFCWSYLDFSLLS